MAKRERLPRNLWITGKDIPKVKKMRKKSRTFCRLLREMMLDEKKAHRTDYPKLLKASKGVSWTHQVPARFTSDVRKIITDEHRHYGLIDGYYRYVCGRQH